MNMENFEGINKIPVPPQETSKEVSVPKKEPKETSLEKWAKEGELKREMNIKEGDERCVLQYEELFNKAREKVLNTFG